MTYAPENLIWHITEAAFETARENDTLQPGYYAITYPDGEPQYAYSPDGIGCIWYNTREDMINGIPAE